MKNTRPNNNIAQTTIFRITKTSHRENWVCIWQSRITTKAIMIEGKLAVTRIRILWSTALRGRMILSKVSPRCFRRKLGRLISRSQLWAHIAVLDLQRAVLAHKLIYINAKERSNAKKRSSRLKMWTKLSKKWTIRRAYLLKWTNLRKSIIRSS